METWSVLLFSSISYTLGVVTVFSGRSLFGLPNSIRLERKVPITILDDDGKIIKYTIILFSIIGIIAAIQHWMVLLREFGSIAGVFLNATKYYRMRVEGEIKGVIPYLFIISYLAVFLSGIYTAYKNKLTLVSVLPIIAVVFKELANLGRSGMLLALFEFVITFMLFRHLLISDLSYKVNKNKLSIILAIIVVFSLIVGGAMAVKNIRNPIDSFQGTSKSLSTFEGNAFISPSIYLYSCSHLGVFNKYLEKQNENPYWGENTFLPVYNFVSKFGVVEHPDFFQEGYFIPMWTNTGTYLREIDADFGKVGLLLIPFSLGLFMTIYWFKFYESGKILYLLVLTYLYLIVSFSFLVMVSRLSSWFISFALLFVLIPFIEKIVKQVSSNKRLSSISIF